MWDKETKTIIADDLCNIDIKRLEEIMEEMANAPPEEPLPSNSHWVGKYLEKKGEQMKELTDSVDRQIELNRKKK